MRSPWARSAETSCRGLSKGRLHLLLLQVLQHLLRQADLLRTALREAPLRLHNGQPRLLLVDHVGHQQHVQPLQHRQQEAVFARARHPVDDERGAQAPHDALRQPLQQLLVRGAVHFGAECAPPACADWTRRPDLHGMRGPLEGRRLAVDGQKRLVPEGIRDALVALVALVVVGLHRVLHHVAGADA